MLQAFESAGYWPSLGESARYVLSITDAVLVIDMHSFNSPMPGVSDAWLPYSRHFATNDGTNNVQIHISVDTKALTRHCTSVHPQLYCVAGLPMYSWHMEWEGCCLMQKHLIGKGHQHLQKHTDRHASNSMVAVLSLNGGLHISR